MTKSARIKELVMRFLEDKKSHTISEIKQYVRSNFSESFTEGQFSGSIDNLLKNRRIEKLDRGVYKILDQDNFLTKESTVSMRKCFVVSPIGDAGSDIRKNADQLYQHIIKPVCEKCGFEAKRVDDFNTSDSITQDILDALNEYDLVIADLTGHNPNVFFEIGYRTKSQKPIIHLKRKGETLPFDVSAIRTFEYDLTDLDMVTATKERLEQVIMNFKYDSIKERKSSGNSFENNLIVSSLNDIQYKIDVLTEEIKKKENETIKTVIETFNAQKQQPESMETEMLKILMPELLRNPNAADALLKLSEKFK
ncbi:nucleoside 2-deoxyribosyltransferase [Anaerostipes sp.]|uniref:nucleoside 2-deoxyribosyltransferase n=1 Tax=Anaerostipes sp. TaxID=1872530 RepID=UPI00258B92ED|nr:nucleoside 2-deoxyribosyltransferase [Anaerostipes sp.]